MGKQLIIAEKPSVAGDIARALGRIPKDGEFFENDKFVVSSAVGHLLEMDAPEQKIKGGKWSLINLPVIPDSFELKPVAKTEARLKLLRKLYARKDIEGVINACDAGREGELIFRHLMTHFRGKKPVRRLWLQSMTPQAIRDGFEQLRGDESMQPLAKAAVCRAESDWLVGINSTRAMTALNSRGGGFSLTTVGRVQTPTLAILMERENKIAAFVSRDFWEVIASFQVAAGIFEAKWIDSELTKKSASNLPEDSRPERIWEKEKADAVAKKCKGESGEVADEKKPAAQSPPRLFDLTSLQRDANRRFGFSARNTLAIAQTLYERHKLLTYPRTDSRALPSDYPPVVERALVGISEFGDKSISPFAADAVSKKMVRPGDRRIFDDAKVSDHFAIIPTGEKPGVLREPERKIFDLVTKYFVAAFYPPAKFQVTTRRVNVEDEIFEVKGRVTTEAGWLAVVGRESEKDGALVAVQKDEKAKAEEIIVEEKQTKPPPRYTEATLLSAMEGAGKFVDDDELREAMRDKGLGTPATRASIIENLVREKYIIRDGRDLIPTPKADGLVKLLRVLGIEELTAPALTGDWEKKLKQIERAEFDPGDFMHEIKEMTRRIIGAAKGIDMDKLEADGDALAAPCPRCGKEVREGLQKYACPSCDFSIRKIIAGRTYAKDEIEALLRDGKIGPLDGFISKKGRPFSAELKFNREKFTVEFDFGNQPESAEDIADLSAADAVGECPKCGAKVRDTARHFICENKAGESPSCDFSIGRRILQREISADNVRALLNEGRTPLLEGFVSSRTNRPFSAHLKMDLSAKTGKLEFEFPPRKKRA